MSDAVSDRQGVRGGDGGRPYVVLLFADLCDSVPLAESTDPEELVRLLQQFENIALEVVDKHGGNACQIYGDGLLVVFGHPAPMENGARRAVEAAIELHEAIRQAIWPSKPRGFEVRLHSAVHAGRVFARRGDALHGSHELVGDAVNTAARLCDQAGRDEILVSDSVLTGIETFFVTEEVGPIHLKGKAEAVLAHRVRGRSDVDSQFEARARAGFTDFVGRETELAHLEDALAGCVPGSPRVVLISGAPGIGKTRLLEEFRQRVSGSGTRVLHGTCDSYGAMALFGPFLQTLRQLFGIQSIELEADMVRRVEEEVRELGPAVEAHLDDFLRLLSLRPWQTDSHGQAQRVHAAPDDIELGDGVEIKESELSLSFGQLFEAVTEREPVLLLLDDWQWADDASREVLEQIRTQNAVGRLCIVVGAREPAALPESMLDEVDAFALRPFSEAESAKMIRELRPNAPWGVLGLGTREIHAHTGGNPLFVEELCRSLPADALAGERALEESVLSATLHGVIQARVSALPAAQTRVIEAASVIGNRFSSLLVANALPDEDVDEILAELSRGDLIYEDEFSGGFRFRHGIMRETIYESVRLAERREIHRAIAQAIEDGVAEPDTSDQLETLAYHYRGCADQDRAARYSELAGDKALATSSLDRARLQFSAALSELDKLPPTPALKQRWLGVYPKWAGVYVYSPSRQQLTTAKQASAYAADVGDDAARVSTGHWSSFMHYVLGEYGTAIDGAQEALELAEQLGNQRLVALLLTTVGQCHAASGDRQQALGCIERGLGLIRNRTGGRRGGTLPMSFAYPVAARASLLGHLGDFDEAHGDIGKAVAAVHGSGHPLEGSVGAMECTIHIYQGNWRRLIDTAVRTREVTARVNSTYTFAMVSVFAAYGRWMLRPTASAPQELIQTIDWLTARGTGLYSSLNYGCVAEAFASAGEFSRSSDFAKRAILRREERDPLGETMAYRALARVEHSRTPGGAAVGDFMRKAFRSAEERGSRREIAVTTLLQAEFFRDAGNGGAAEAGARQALLEFEAMRMAWHAERARELLTRG